MAQININNLTFYYDGSSENIFENVSFSIDTNWKLGFVGRNGRGKTTFLKLLLGKYEYVGEISSSVKFNYFPFEVENKTRTAYQIAEELLPEYEQWILDRELNLLEVSEECRVRAFDSLSGGEQTKILLAVLFLHDNNFLLIDEPTNHLDAEARQVVGKYLNGKKGFILVSHDRAFLDGCVDHVLSINKTNIEVQSGNFSSWFENKTRQDDFERFQNQKLEGEINRLKNAAKQKLDWSNAAEGKKQGAPDKGFVGAKAARQAKTSKIIERRQNDAIQDKAKLLKNIETAENLKILPLSHLQNTLVSGSGVSVSYGNRQLFNNINFTINQKDRIVIKGKNGVGKTTILKLLMGESINHGGALTFANGLKISYLPQDISNLKGTPKELAIKSRLDLTVFMAMLSKLDFKRSYFEKDMSLFSEGQKKKVLIAKSLSESAHIYVWDEPLNYIDIFSRMQIENLILEYMPTLVFVEHDVGFSEKIATKELILS